MVDPMTTPRSDTLSAAFQAMADPTRRAILARLASGEATAGELAAPFEISLPAVSKHLKVLEGAGLLVRKREGRVHRCRLDPAPMNQAVDWIEAHRRFWEARFDSLAQYLEELMTESRSSKETQVPRRTCAMKPAPGLSCG